MVETKGCQYRPATICRINGWGVGTKLIGDEGRGPEIIEITAIGLEAILARSLSLRGEERRYKPENTWTLEFRDWKEYKPE